MNYMTDSGNDVFEDAKEAAFFPKDRDWLLADLIRLLANNGAEIGITLNVEGQSISGVLISAKTYCKEVSEQFRDISESKNDLYQAVSTLFSNYIKIYDVPNTDDDGYPIQISYVHLRDAKVFTPSGGMPSGDGTYWRGRLNKVSGFSIGQLS